MKNYYNLFVSAGLALMIGVGCGYVGSSGPAGPENSNRSLSDKAIDSGIGRSNVGVPECDRVLDAIEAELNNPDDNFVVRAAKATALNRIKDNIRLEIEKYANNRTELVSTCTEFKKQFDNYKSSQQKPESAER